MENLILNEKELRNKYIESINIVNDKIIIKYELRDKDPRHYFSFYYYSNTATYCCFVKDYDTIKDYIYYDDYNGVYTNVKCKMNKKGKNDK